MNKMLFIRFTVSVSH